jgi:hypothetical protein
LAPSNELDRLSPQLPSLKFGFRLAGFLFLTEIVWGIQREFARGSPEARSAGGYAGALYLVGALVGTAFLLHCISTYHSVLSRVDGWSHPISQKRAVRFHFIPIFNLYWNYKWPSEIARFVNWRTQAHRMSGVLAGSIVLSGYLFAGFVDTSIGLVIILSGFAYISRCLREAFAGVPVPSEL